MKKVVEKMEENGQMVEMDGQLVERVRKKMEFGLGMVEEAVMVVKGLVEGMVEVLVEGEEVAEV